MSIHVGAHVALASLTQNVATFTSSAIATQQAGRSTFVVAVGWYNAVNITSLVDNKGNRYTQIQSAVNYPVDSKFQAALFYCQNGAGGAGHTFTVNFSAAAQNVAMFCVEVVGGLSSGILDQAPAGFSDAHADTSPFVSAATGITAQAVELVLAFTHTYSTAVGTEVPTWNAGYAAIDSLQDTNFWTGYSGFLLTSVPGAQQSSLNVTGGTSQDGLTFIATFRDGPTPALSFGTNF
jgi:hypothetical protein